MGLTVRAPFAVVALAFAAGIWLASQFALPLWLVLMACALSAVGAIAIGHTRPSPSRESLWLAIFLALIAFGALRYGLAQTPNVPTARYANQRVTLDGVVVAEPDVRPTHTNLRVRPVRVAGRDSIDASDDVSHGVVLVRADLTTTWHYGDVIRADGRLNLPPRMIGFDYRDYLARRGVPLWMPSPARVWRIGEEQGDAFFTGLLSAKDAVRQAVVRMLPMPESALLNGVLIGDDNAIPQTLSDAFRRTGTSHIVAISGFNVSIVITIVVGLLSRLVNPRPAAAIALPAIALYTVFVGASPSVVRAAVMAVIGLVGLLLWRRGFTLNTLCAAAFVMLLVDPNVLFDLGFQLSFMATLGLVIYADRFSEPVHAWVDARVTHRIGRWALLLALDGVLLTTAAQVTTLPLIVAAFNQLSLVTLFANALVLPLQPPLMVTGAAVAAIGVALPQVANVLAWVPYVFLTGTIRIVEGMSVWPFASVRVGWFGTAAAAVYYLGLIAVTWVIALPAEHRGLMARQLRQRAFSAGAVAVCGGLLIAGLIYWLQRPDGKLHIALRGGSALVQTPSGQQLVFLNGGNVLPMLETGLPVWDRTIEWLVVAHADDAAISDAQLILEHFDAQSAVVASAHASVPLSASSIITVNVGGTQLVPEPRMAMYLSGGAMASINLRLIYGDTSISLVASCSAKPMPPSDIVLADPRSCSAEQIATMQPHWLVWADDGLQPDGMRRADRVFSLAQIDQLVFVGDGKRLILER